VFPEANPELKDGVIEKRFAQWLELRGVIAQAMEPARQQKLVGNAQEASVVLEIADAALLEEAGKFLPELEEAFILSHLELRQGVTNVAHVTRNPNAKCSRCWRHKPSVGKFLVHPELCEDCQSVMGDVV